MALQKNTEYNYSVFIYLIEQLCISSEKYLLTNVILDKSLLHILYIINVIKSVNIILKKSGISLNSV